MLSIGDLVAHKWLMKVGIVIGWYKEMYPNIFWSRRGVVMPTHIEKLVLLNKN